MKLGTFYNPLVVEIKIIFYYSNKMKEINILTMHKFLFDVTVRIIQQLISEKRDT